MGHPLREKVGHPQKQILCRRLKADSEFLGIATQDCRPGLTYAGPLGLPTWQLTSSVQNRGCYFGRMGSIAASRTRPGGPGHLSPGRKPWVHRVKQLSSGGTTPHT